VTALVTKIQQEAHWDFTPEIALFPYSGQAMPQKQWAGRLKSCGVRRDAFCK